MTYNEAIKLNNEDMKKETGNEENLNFLKKKIESLNTIFKEIIGIDLKHYKNLKIARNIKKICDNIESGYNTINNFIENKIKEENDKYKLFKIYNFIIGYNHLLKLLKLSKYINENEIKQKITESSSTGS